MFGHETSGVPLSIWHYDTYVLYIDKAKDTFVIKFKQFTVAAKLSCWNLWNTRQGGMVKNN